MTVFFLNARTSEKCSSALTATPQEVKPCLLYTSLYCALVSYIVFEGPEEERNMNTLVEMINSMEVREDDETFKNAVDYRCV